MMVGFLAGSVVQLSTDLEVFGMGFGWLAGGIKGAGGAWGLLQQVPAHSRGGVGSSHHPFTSNHWIPELQPALLWLFALQYIFV